MARKQATPEQQAKAAERRAAFKDLCQRVAAMSEDQRAQLAASMPIVNPLGHPLSAYNHCLIYSQFSGTPTIVGGFKQWLTAGRIVRKGESGLMIWCPTGKRKAADGPELAADENERPSFIPGYVFDITQTDERSAE